MTNLGDEYPFSEIKENNYYLREFDSNIDHEDLKWHFDEEFRKVEVVKSNGWKFQYDNQMPIILEVGDILDIEPFEYHRCIKGDDNLIVKIYKN